MFFWVGYDVMRTPELSGTHLIRPNRGLKCEKKMTASCSLPVSHKKAAGWATSGGVD
jgi:hypothetical protein